MATPRVRSRRPWCPTGGQPRRTGDTVIVQDGNVYVSCGCGKLVELNDRDRLLEHRMGKGRAA